MWNCNVLAHALSSLISENNLRTALHTYEPAFHRQMLTLMRAKLGLKIVAEEDGQLINQLLQSMHNNEVDYTLIFRRLCDFDMASDNRLRPG